MAEGTAVDRGPGFRWDHRVPKYDAFGREIGEDTLAGLGGSSHAAPQPVERPEPRAEPLPERAAEPAAPTVPAPAPAMAIPGPRRRRAGGVGCLVGLVILAAVVAGPIIAVVSFIGAADDAIDEVKGALDGTQIQDLGVETVDEPPPVGIAGRSMVRERNFGGALQTLRDEGLGGGAVLIRLSPDRVWAQLAKGGRIRGATIDHRGELDPGTATAGGGGGLKPIPLGEIDAGAPVRLVRASAERFPALRPNRLDYLVGMRDPIGGGQRWLAYYRDDRGYVEGDRRGRIQRRVTP